MKNIKLNEEQVDTLRHIIISTVASDEDTVTIGAMFADAIIENTQKALIQNATFAKIREPRASTKKTKNARK